MSDHRGLLLDLDGTLADSLGALVRVYDQFLSSVDREGAGSSTEFTTLNGLRLDAIVAYLRNAHHLEDSSTDELVALYRELLAHGMRTVQPAPGAADLLRSARLSGWVTCVVTSGRSDQARQWLGKTGLDPLVLHVVGGEMVAKGKPDPEPYRTGLTLCDASARESVAVEDSALGATSAIAAGIRTFFLVPDGPAGGSQAPMGAAGVVSSLREVEHELAR